MSDFKVTYKGNFSTEMVHLESGQAIITDAPKDNQGLGRTFSPTDLIASSLASCMITIIAIAAKTHKINIINLESNIKKTMSKTLPRKISKIDVELNVEGEFDEKSKLIIERSAKNCPVHHSLSKDMIINVNIKYITI